MARNLKLAFVLGDDLADRIVASGLVTPGDVEKLSDDALVALLGLTDAQLEQLRAVFPRKDSK